MPRKYKKKLGSRDYKNYSDRVLERALTAVVEGRLTLRGASERYGIPYGTVYNRYHGKNIKKPGAQTIFTESEEKLILESAAKCAEWGFPLNSLDLRMLAKALLDRQGRVVNKFQNNLPGVDWAYSVLKRHNSDYSVRVASNIKRARARVSPETIKEYFKNLENVIKDVPPSNIFNFDETNMSDDPGKMIGLFRRGVKYPEKAINFSKGTTVMVCGSADGVLLPPYIIYKSTHLYDTWKEQAPCGPPCCDQPCCSQGSRFNRTASGWIDGPTFRDWFDTCFLPHARRLNGRKVLIGDNLSSHLDNDVLRQCSLNNIDFVCLVPNSTHLTQPLDVAFFRPMKLAWRQTLMHWKMQRSKAASVPKDTFPMLLKKAIVKLDQTAPKPSSQFKDITSGVKRNMMSGFCATGIYPFDMQKVLKRLPQEKEITEEDVDSTLTSFLRESRYGANPDQPARKKKRLTVVPGRSIPTIEDNPQDNDQDRNDDEIDLDVEMPGPSQGAPMPHNSLPENIVTNTDLLRAQTQGQTENSSSDIDGPEGEDEDLECVVDRFIIAKFFTARGKKMYKYVCQIVSLDPLLVEGFKSLDNDKKRFKRIKNDISEVEKSDIISFLPKPVTVDDYVEFPYNINVLEL